MKKLLLVTALFALLISFSFAQKPYKVVFYNLENFFDTINDPEVHDDEFTPEGPKKWNSAKYNKKLANTERVFFVLQLSTRIMPVIIGVSEVRKPQCTGRYYRNPQTGSGKLSDFTFRLS